MIPPSTTESSQGIELSIVMPCLQSQSQPHSSELHPHECCPRVSYVVLRALIFPQNCGVVYTTPRCFHRVAISAFP